VTVVVHAIRICLRLFLLPTFHDPVASFPQRKLNLMPLDRISVHLINGPQVFQVDIKVRTPSPPTPFFPLQLGILRFRLRNCLNLATPSPPGPPPSCVVIPPSEWEKVQPLKPPQAPPVGPVFCTCTPPQRKTMAPPAKAFSDHKRTLTNSHFPVYFKFAPSCRAAVEERHSLVLIRNTP